MYFFVALFEDYANIRSVQGMEMLQLSTNERLMVHLAGLTITFKKLSRSCVSNRSGNSYVSLILSRARNSHVHP